MRHRVRGTGADRKALPSFKLLGKMPKELIEKGLELARFTSTNDLGSDSYEISKHCSLIHKVPCKYRQLLLQRVPVDQGELSEEDYFVWTEEARQRGLARYIDKNFKGAFRTRLACLPPGGELDWHIDANTSVNCRIHVCLQNENSVFEVKRRNKVESYVFGSGEIWFANTGWPHRVRNLGPFPRVNIIFGIHYERIASRF